MMKEFTEDHHETIGKVKEFMLETRGFKKTLFTIAIAISVQVCTFLYLWGGLSTTVTKNTDFIWNELGPKATENTRNIDRILTKLEYIVDKQ